MVIHMFKSTQPSQDGASETTPTQQDAAPTDAPQTDRLTQKALHTPRLLRQTDIIHLQRSLGNQAVQRLLAKPHSPTAQREIVSSKYAAADKAVVEDYAKKVSDVVEKVFFAVGATPLLGEWATLDGYTELWVDKLSRWIKDGTKPELMAASFGYVIESIATGPLLPPAPSGMNIVKQAARGGTRPDLVLTKGGADVAWLDLTAKKSAGHIFNKEGGWQQTGNYAEIAYPSVEDSDLLTLKANAEKNASGKFTIEGIDMEAAKEAMKAAKEALAAKRLAWRVIVTNWLVKVPNLRRDPILQSKKRRDYTMAILKEKLGLSSITPNQTVSILAAVYLDQKTYGFDNSDIFTTLSAGTGLSILQEHDPSEKKEAVSTLIEELDVEKPEEGALAEVVTDASKGGGGKAPKEKVHSKGRRGKPYTV
jgi:hypothetical protein